MANKSNGVEEWVRAPPPEGSVWERTAKVIYNPQEKSFLGRTPKRWAILFAFYLVFYTVLALMFALCMGGLFLSLDDSRPTYILSRSLIGSNPGVSHRPLAQLVRYKVDTDIYYAPYMKHLEMFFTPYSSENWYSSQTECVAADNYGYPDTPCFFIKINRIFGWKPDYYDAASLPHDMPEDLLEFIRQNALPAELNRIWISCGDEESNDTKIEYPWGRGLPGDMYPYMNSEGYRSPVVAVKVTSAAKNNLITIRCRAWVKNIVYNKSLKEASGYTRFQLYLEDDTVANATDVATSIAME